MRVDRPSHPTARNLVAISGGAVLAGGLAGALAGVTLGEPLRASLEQAVSLYVGGWLAGDPGASPPAALHAALDLDLRAAALVWIGGLFAYGWALTVTVLFAAGFAAGFALTALASAARAWVTLAAAAPTLAAAALLACLGAVALWLANRQQQARRGRCPPPTGATYAGYAAVLAAAIAGLAVAALVQAYALPWAVRLLAASPARLAHPWQL